MDKIIKPNLTGTYLKKIRIYSYDKIYVVDKSSSFPCCVSLVSGIKTYLHPILKSVKRVLKNSRFRSITINSVVKSPFRCLVIHISKNVYTHSTKR